MPAHPIRVDYWAKPIPLRRFDYIAMYANDDGDCGIYGEGATEAAAVLDLIENHPRPEPGDCDVCDRRCPVCGVPLSAADWITGAARWRNDHVHPPMRLRSSD